MLDQREPGAVEHVVGLGDVGRVQADDVAGRSRSSRESNCCAEVGGLGGVDVRIVEEGLEVVRAQQFQEAAAHT